MHSRLFTFAALFASGALASNNWVKVDPNTANALRDLRVRTDGDQSFKPGTTPGYGDSCEEAFGGGYTECADSQVCYNPDEGHICCDAGYPCPKDSWCLGDGYCCPDGVTAEDCAKDLGIKPPASTQRPKPTPSTSKPAPKPTKDSGGDVVTLTTTVCECSNKPKPTGPAPKPTGHYPTGGQPTGGKPQPTGGVPTKSQPPSQPTNSPPPFNAATSGKGVATGTLVLAALVGLVQNVL